MAILTSHSIPSRLQKSLAVLLRSLDLSAMRRARALRKRKRTLRMKLPAWWNSIPYFNFLRQHKNRAVIRQNAEKDEQKAVCFCLSFFLCYEPKCKIDQFESTLPKNRDRVEKQTAFPPGFIVEKPQKDHYFLLKPAFFARREPTLTALFRLI